ncbi:hypothetical protein ACP70R_001006 [Stipagrostis hirtigluma subsp. patula]
MAPPLPSAASSTSSPARRRVRRRRAASCRSRGLPPPPLPARALNGAAVAFCGELDLLGSEVAGQEPAARRGAAGQDAAARRGAATSIGSLWLPGRVHDELAAGKHTSRRYREPKPRPEKKKRPPGAAASPASGLGARRGEQGRSGLGGGDEGISRTEPGSGRGDVLEDGNGGPHASSSAKIRQKLLPGGFWDFHCSRYSNPESAPKSVPFGSLTDSRIRIAKSTPESMGSKRGLSAYSK